MYVKKWVNNKFKNIYNSENKINKIGLILKFKNYNRYFIKNLVRLKKLIINSIIKKVIIRITLEIYIRIKTWKEKNVYY
jgi:hypothetical protein